MDRIMLFEAAREGKLDVLQNLVQQNPSILADVRLTSLTESVLHVATKWGHLNFVNELMKMDPQNDVARDMNKDGFRPLDIAVIMGNLPIVKTILSHNRDVARLRGKDNRTALHYAAVKGRVDIINELLSTCPDCIQDVTVHAETALHLAVKYHQLDAFYELVKWLQGLSKESIINDQDGDGNTVLHLAVLNKQYACLNLLLDPNCSIRSTIKLNIQNLKGLTALDISDIVMHDSYDAKIRESLQRGGAIRGQDSTTTTPQDPPPDHHTNSQPHDHLQPEPGSRNWFKYFKFQSHRDSPSDTRNVLLIVSALITTVTFQAAINPPSALFDQSRILSTTTTSDNKKLVAFVSDFIFVFFNTLGFISSSLVIIYLTSGFPLHRELLVSLSSMFITYSAAMDVSVSGTRAEAKIQVMAWIIQLVALVLPHLLRRPPWLKMRGLGRFWKRAVRNGVVLPIGN